MRTNIDIDEKLLAKAQKLGNIKTKKMMVEKALELYVQLQSQKRISGLRGKIEFHEDAFE
jgi:Arc/MetJ family transcription regulator